MMPGRRPSRLGLVTIGQAPRDDVVPGMLCHLPADCEVLQAGALDGLGAAEIRAMAPGPGDYVLATRLADGSAATVARRFVLPRLAAAVADLEGRGCEVTAVLCTGTFPELATAKLLVEPERIFHAVCTGVADKRRLGAIIPLAAQIPQATARWRAAGVEAVVAAASPYGPPERLVAAARELRGEAVDLVALDCFGFTAAMRSVVRRETGCPTLLPGTYLARVLGELLAV